MTVGKKIKNARKKLKLTQRKLSEITGIHYNTIAHYEGDRTEPPLSYAVKIADALGISLNYLARSEL